MYPYFVEAILLQWISGYSSGLHCVSSENCVFIWTHLTYFLPFFSLNALSWVQIEFSLVSVQSFSIYVFILVRWVLNNATYVFRVTMDVMRTRYVKRMEKCSVASSEVSGHFARSNSTCLTLKTNIYMQSLMNPNYTLRTLCDDQFPMHRGWLT